MRQASWRVPAGASPAQVRRSSRLVLCCVVEGDNHCEVYTTIVCGGLLSRERYYAAEAEAVDIVEGMRARYARAYRSVREPVLQYRTPSFPCPDRALIWFYVYCAGICLVHLHS